jgi:hypothetical protein|tara:strand:+ start:65821 stop:65925 length:105 start_codon:yes stop_codon:yes gene_type:complete
MMILGRVADGNSGEQTVTVLTVSTPLFSTTFFTL